MKTSENDSETELRWPAEWEPHAATWLTWPHNPETWPGQLVEARREYAAIVAALAGRESVRLLVADAAAEDGARRALEQARVETERHVQFMQVPTDDSWIRDYGPIFVEGGAPRHFVFDAWGGKYPPWEADAQAAALAASELGIELARVDFVLEGGSIDGNGAGCVMTTESCLLNPNRGPGRTREGVEARLAETLGTRQVVWLADGIAGDDTDGHIDDLARFVAPETIVAVGDTNAGDRDAPILVENLRRLRAARTLDGRSFEVVTLPSPPPHVVAGQRCPASYANFYLANGVALVPTFDAPTDARALAILAELLPEREIVGVPCGVLVLGLGAVHCLTQQEPWGVDPVSTRA
jgi:agmatine deiminase